MPRKGRKNNKKAGHGKHGKTWPLYHLYAALGVPAPAPLPVEEPTSDDASITAKSVVTAGSMSPLVVSSPLYDVAEGAGESPEDATTAPRTTQRKHPSGVRHKAIAAAFSCSTCKACFADLQGQRAHFQSDWHVLNLKRALKGQAVLDEAEAAEGLGEESESSGSDTDSKSKDKSKDTTAGAGGAVAVTPPPRMPCVTLLVGGTHKVRLYRATLPDPDSVRDGDSCTPSDVLVVSPRDVWVVILFRSGHFAGAVFQEGRVLAHKCFHRYTTRRKQGGAQSTRDSGGGGRPRSIGSSMRRANEVALREDMQSLLRSWDPYMRVATRIFIGWAKTNNNWMFGGDSALKKDDPRLRRIPFGTKRPTFGETQLVYEKLVTADVRKIPRASKPSGVRLGLPPRAAATSGAGAGAGASAGAGSGAGSGEMEGEMSQA